MFRKITLLALVALSTTSTFIACSSSDNDKDIEVTENSSFNIIPPNWLQGKWLHGGYDDEYYIFSKNNIETERINWRESYDEYLKTPTPKDKNVKYYNKISTEVYYEAECTDVNGIVKETLQVKRLTEDAIQITKVTYSPNETYRVGLYYKK